MGSFSIFKVYLTNYKWFDRYITTIYKSQMVQGTFVLSVFSKRDEEKIRMVNFRRTKMRYLVVVIAIFVVFGCEYCFDNASVS